MDLGDVSGVEVTGFDGHAGRTGLSSDTRHDGAALIDGSAVPLSRCRRVGVVGAGIAVEVGAETEIHGIPIRDDSPSVDEHQHVACVAEYLNPVQGVGEDGVDPVVSSEKLFGIATQTHACHVALSFIMVLLENQDIAAVVLQGYPAHEPC